MLGGGVARDEIISYKYLYFTYFFGFVFVLLGVYGGVSKIFYGGRAGQLAIHTCTCVCVSCCALIACFFSVVLLTNPPPSYPSSTTSTS